MIYGYIKTVEADIDKQKLKILDYANKNGLSVEMVTEIVNEKLIQNALIHLLKDISEGDTLIITKLSSLGYAKQDIFTTIKTILSKGAQIKITDGNHLLKGNDMELAFSLAEELEKDLKADQRKIKRVFTLNKVGRPHGSTASKLDKNIEEIRALVSNKVSYAAIGRIYNMSATAVRHFCESRGLAELPRSDKT